MVSRRKKGEALAGMSLLKAQGLAPRAGLPAVSSVPAAPAAADPRAGFVIQDDVSGGFAHGFRWEEGVPMMALLYSADDLRRLWSGPQNSAWIYRGDPEKAWLLPFPRFNSLVRDPITNLMEIKGSEPARPAYPREDGSTGLTDPPAPFRNYTFVAVTPGEHVPADEMPDFLRSQLSVLFSAFRGDVAWARGQAIRFFRKDYEPAEAAWSSDLRAAVFGLALISLGRPLFWLAALAYFLEHAFDEDATIRDGMLDYAFWERAPWRQEPWYGHILSAFGIAWGEAQKAAFGDFEAMAQAHVLLEVAHYLVTDPLAAGVVPASPRLREVVAVYGERLAAWGPDGVPRLDADSWRLHDADLAAKIATMYVNRGDMSTLPAGFDHPSTKLWPGGEERLLECMDMLREIAATIEFEPLEMLPAASAVDRLVAQILDPLEEIVPYGDARGTVGKLRYAPPDVLAIWAEKDRKARNVLLMPPPGQYGKHYAQPQVGPDGQAILVSLAFPGFRVEARNHEAAIEAFIKKMKTHIDALRAAGVVEIPNWSLKTVPPTDNRVLAVANTFDLDDPDFGY